MTLHPVPTPPEEPSAGAATTPGHALAACPGWSVWRDVALRGSGFAVGLLESFTSPALGCATQQLLQLEEARSALAARARKRCYARLSDNQTLSDEQRRSLRRAMQKLRGEHAPAAGNVDAELDALTSELRAIVAATDSAREHWQHEHARGRDQASAALQRWAADARLREAVTWQNPQLVHTALDQLLKPGGAADESRRREHLLARYLQRYAAKNDTIGFFGPVGWASVEGQEPVRLRLEPVPLRQEPMPPVLDAAAPDAAAPAADSAPDPAPLAMAAQADFEPWAVQALQQAVTADAALRPLFVPRRHPSWRAGPSSPQGPSLVVLQRALRLPPLEQALFEASDGQRNAAKVVAHVVAQGLASGAGRGAPMSLAPGLVHAAVARAAAVRTPVKSNAAWAAFERLCSGGLLVLAPAVPLVVAPLTQLQAALDALELHSAPDPNAAAQRLQHWRHELQALQALRLDAQANFERDRGALAPLLAELDQRFSALSGRSATHLAGDAYAGRTLLNVDARRRHGLAVGEPLMREMAECLRPVLDAAHWYACQAYSQLDHFAQSQFNQHARDGLMPLDSLWRALQHERHTLSAIVADVAEQLAERWATVCPPGSQLTPAEAQRRAKWAFVDVAPGWPGARFQAPDMMLAARDEASVRAGDFHFVLGELHAADRSLLRQLFVNHHPQPERLLAAATIDGPEPTLRPLFRSDAMMLRTRTPPLGELHLDIECDQLRSALPAHRALRSGELWLRRGADGGLHIHSSERPQLGPWPWHAFFGPQVVILAGSGFTLTAPREGGLRIDGQHESAPREPGRGEHQARSSIGRMVATREAWRLPLPEFSGAHEKTAAARYLALRRVAQQHGLPRLMFYRLPDEPKPLYLDWDSSLYVDLFARAVRAAQLAGASHIGLSEMLPAPEDCWLSDERGQRYTSEWRLLFVRQDH